MQNERRNKPILVFGGTGHYGRHVVWSLLKKGQTVRVLSRNVMNAYKILGEGFEIVEGDITSKASVVASLKGVKAIVIGVSALTWRLIRKLQLIERDSVLMVLDEAEKEAVTRVVYLSAYDIRRDLLKKLNIKLELAEIKFTVETALAESNFNWTVLGCAPSMQLFFAMIRRSTMMVPGGGPAALPNISPVDVGEITAQAVLRDDLAGKRFRMTGPEALSFPQAARRISIATGKTIKFRKIPLFPIRFSSFLLRPLDPFLSYAYGFIKLMNNFPQDLVAQVPEDHRLLVETFSYTSITLEMEARRLSEMSRQYYKRE